jgi:hypothetical protein
LNHLFSLSRKAVGPVVVNGSNRPTEQESQTPGGRNHSWQRPRQVTESISQHFSTFHPCTSSAPWLCFGIFTCQF